MGEKRVWSLETARSMLGEVRERTGRAVGEVESLLEDLENLAGEERERAAERVRQVVSLWAREMEALGLEVKGPWLVDFDNGSGYYCWRWPEEALVFFHDYEAGFAGRVRIQ